MLQRPFWVKDAGIRARYEQCEDMACALTEHAQTLAFKDNFSEAEVLTKCHQGMLAGDANFSRREAAWVVLRLAELLGWKAPKELIAELADQ